MPLSRSPMARMPLWPTSPTHRQASMPKSSPHTAGSITSSSTALAVFSSSTIFFREPAAFSSASLRRMSFSSALMESMLPLASLAPTTGRSLPSPHTRPMTMMAASPYWETESHSAAEKALRGASLTANSSFLKM